jgi:xylulose-5-phosphate/fructose-6-phosphate phosphoketolase
VKQAMSDLLVDHTEYIREHGDDMPMIRDWRWQ